MIPYGKMFEPGEVLLMHVNDEPAFFARVEDVQPDRKKNWWRLVFTMLTIPLKKMTWILDEDQMRGQAFTMSSVPVEIKRVEAPAEDSTPGQDPTKEDKEKPKPKSQDGNVISMFEED